MNQNTLDQWQREYLDAAISVTGEIGNGRILPSLSISEIDGLRALCDVGRYGDAYRQLKRYCGRADAAMAQKMARQNREFDLLRARMEQAHPDAANRQAERDAREKKAAIEQLSARIRRSKEANQAPITALPAFRGAQDVPEMTPDDTTANEPVGITKREVISVDWPLFGTFTQDSLSRALSDVPIWMVSARVLKGSPGKASALWNPAQLADCLAEKGHANRKALDTFLRKHFAEWLPEWEKLQEHR